MSARGRSHRRSFSRQRNQLGVVMPSPVVMLSVIAVAMAAIAFVATRGGEPAEREVTPVAGDAAPSQSPSPTYTPTKESKPKPKPPAVQRGKVYVEVYNNSGITGLAGEVGARTAGMGWQVVGTDNWYGTIPATTVYYPADLKAAGKQLALDLGVERAAPAVDPMRMDRLTLILTEPLS
ncbi:MAG: LytR C-terminal domain-containing protein [Nocardioides sp.]